MSDPAVTELEPASASGHAAAPYLVIARRYRPQSFDELVGQEHIAQVLANAIRSGRVGHAYLFTGALGVGKTSTARIFAKALNCQQGPTPTPCNQCDLCQSINRGDDIDVLEIDGASNRGIDEIRELRQNVGVRPSRSRFKVYIIDEVHMLTREAFNALLKTLEEPPGHVKFIFCTTEPQKIPITILSRCQRFDFSGVDIRGITDRLAKITAAEGVQAESEALEILARRAGGSMRDAQSLLEQLLAVGAGEVTVDEVQKVLGTAADQQIADLIQALVRRDASAALTCLDQALAEGVELSQLLDQLLGYLRDLMVRAAGGAAERLLYVSPGQYEPLTEQADNLGLATILAAMQMIDHARARMRYSNQPRILAEMALVRIARLEDLEDLATAVSELRGPAAAASSAKAAVTSRAEVSREARTSGQKKSAEPVPAVSPMAHAPTLMLTAENATQIWRQALGRLKDLTAEYASSFERVAIGAPNQLVVHFKSSYNPCKAFCERPRQLAKIEQALAAVVGSPVRVRFELIEGDDTPESEQKVSPPRVASARQRLQEAAQHPFVRRAGELFDARPTKVEES